MDKEFYTSKDQSKLGKISTGNQPSKYSVELKFIKSETLLVYKM